LPIDDSVIENAMDRFFFFRPGEEARMLARCQFSVDEAGQCGAMFTYSIPGYPWRRNVMKSFGFELSEADRALLFREVTRLREEHPAECLSNHQLWSDTSEKGNGITRDKISGTLCVTIGIFVTPGETREYFSMREDSEALLSSPMYRIIKQLINPHERLPVA
jgi:hypothetical protein